MAQRLVVPDASVILKWVLPSKDEPNLGQALELRDSIADGRVRAIVPSLWFYEVGNTLARRRPEHAEHGVFVTADQRYIGRAGQAGFVMPLSEWTVGEP